MRLLLSLFILATLAVSASSTTINVPADQPSIQAGIDAVSDGDTVFVGPGVYSGAGNRDIVFWGKSLRLLTGQGSARATIDIEGEPSDLHRAFLINNHEDTSTQIVGFVIKNGYHSNGSAVFIDGDASPVFSRCEFLNNTNNNDYGTAVTCQGSAAPVFRECYFADNTGDYGGAIRLVHSAHAHINRCVFVNNTANFRGGAIRFDAEINSSTVEGCTFFGNYAPIAAALDFAQVSIQQTVSACVLAYNTGGSAAAGPGVPTVQCTNVYGNEGGDWIDVLENLGGIGGNIAADPEFCDTAFNQLTLQETSPCLQENNSCNVLMGALGPGCSGFVTDFGLDGEAMQNVRSHNPSIYWVYVDLTGNIQERAEIAVGTDDDWQYAEMWNPAPFVSSDTFVVYVGSDLIDGTAYYLRLRVHNGMGWSPWCDTTFRMNSVPSTPECHAPIDDALTDNQPWLWLRNSSDAEEDALTYDFVCVVDTAHGEPDSIYEYGIVEGTDSTGWQVAQSLDENKRYTWAVRANDGYEYSDWAGAYEHTFFVNSTPEPPTAPVTQYPPDTSGLPVFEMLPTFTWSESYDPDPLDTVRYKLEVSIDPNFDFVLTVDSLLTNQYTRTDSLTFATHYWWRVTAYDNTGLVTPSPSVADFWTWELGDVDHNHSVDIADLVYLVAYMFSGGPAPSPLFVADINGDCSPGDIADLVYLVAYMFQGGPPPMVGCAIIP